MTKRRAKGQPITLFPQAYKEITDKLIEDEAGKYRAEVKRQRVRCGLEAA